MYTYISRDIYITYLDIQHRHVLVFGHSAKIPVRIMTFSTDKSNSCFNIRFGSLTFGTDMCQYLGIQHIVVLVFWRSTKASASALNSAQTSSFSILIFCIDKWHYLYINPIHVSVCWHLAKTRVLKTSTDTFQYLDNQYRCVFWHSAQTPFSTLMFSTDKY